MKQKTRRGFLQGAGSIIIGLPASEFCYHLGFGTKLFAQSVPVKAPRLVTMSFPNGCTPEFWNFDVALQPLADIRAKIILIQNAQNSILSEATRDRHEQGAGSLFTGLPLLNGRKGTGISIDQWLSRRIDTNTALQKPLVAGVWRGFAAGGFRPLSWIRRSWMENGDPVEPYVKPLEIFKALFGDKSSIADKKINIERQKSILDTVVAQMKSYTSDSSKLPASHKHLLLDHLEKIRDLEKRVTVLQNDVFNQCVVPKMQPPVINFADDGLLPYSEFERVYRLQMDLMALALQCEITRTGSLMFCGAGEEYINSSISSIYSDHKTSHYNIAAIKNININYRKFHASNLRYFMNKLADANILDDTTILFGSEFGEGRTHSGSPHPHLIAGGGGKLKMGQTIDAGKGQHTINDIYASLLTGLGHSTPTFGLAKHNRSQIAGMLK